MNGNRFWKTVLAIAFVLASTGPARAQLQAGNLYGTVIDEEDQPLPGVRVTLAGIGAPQVQATDRKGSFHFLGLSPGVYNVAMELTGFMDPGGLRAVIGVGRNTVVEARLYVSTFDVDFVLTEGTPLLDPRRVSIGETISREELEKVPTARNPWAILQTVPGVRLDQAVWSLEGMVITDMSAVGSPPGHFDFDSFQEMLVTTGGSDASLATGVALDMVTKRGTEEWRGSARYLTGRRGDEVSEYGAEVGGPLLKDRLWAWGSQGDQEIGDVLGGLKIEDRNLKVNSQATASNSAVVFVWQDEESEAGRGAGPGSTAWKIEDTQAVGSHLYLSGLFALIDEDLELESVRTERSQKQARLDATSFLDVGDLSHELHYGAGHRTARTDYAFAQDTLAAGRLTASVGLRYDRQGGMGFEWRTLSPRLGLTWALDETEATLLQAGYSRYAGQLAAAFADRTVYPGLSAPITDELILGLEHAVDPELAVGFNLRYRRLRNLLEGVLDDGFLLRNSDREQGFRVASLTLYKRLAYNWMARGNVSWQDWTRDIPSPENQGSGRGWSYSLDGLYQVAPEQGWGFNVGAALNGRPDVQVLDLRLEKELRFSKVAGLTLGADLLNALSESDARFVRPRILRLGARLSWR